MDKMFQINDVSQKCGDVVQHAERFLPFAQQKMGFNKPVNINFLSDPENAKNPLGKTAYYDPNDMKIVVFVDKRHLKDIMRSLSHELVHHTQNCRGDLEGDNYTGPGYAQKDKHMRKMEGEAYLHGNLCFRDWEDSLKKENSEMNEAKLRKHVNNLIKEVLDEADEVEEGKKRKKKSKGKPDYLDFDGDGNKKETMKKALADKKAKKRKKDLEEVKDVDEMNPDSMEETVDEVKDKCAKCKKEGKPCPKDCPGRKKMEETVNEGDEEVVEEAEESDNPLRGKSVGERKPEETPVDTLKKKLPPGKKPAPQKENWYKGNKDQLLFERLTKKWAK